MAGKLTAATSSGLYGYARPGSGIGLTFGSLSAEPWPGFVVDALVTYPGAGSDSLTLVGDTVATFTETSFTVNGVSWTISQPGVLGSGITAYNLTPTFDFVDTASYSIASASDTAIPADYLHRVTPDTVEGPTISPALPAAVDGKRVFSTQRGGTLPRAGRYMAIKVSVPTSSGWPAFIVLSDGYPSWSNNVQIAGASFWLSFCIGTEDATNGNRLERTGTDVVPVGEMRIFEAWLDEPANRWRGETLGMATEIDTTGYDTGLTGFMYAMYDSGTMELAHSIIMPRIPTTAERANIRAAMAVAPPVITSSPTVYVKEGQPVNFFVTADKPRANLSVTGGADATKFTTAGAELIWEDGLPRDYDTPDDTGTNGVYEIEVTWTDLDGLTATQNISIVLQRQAIFEPVFPYGHLEGQFTTDFMGEDNLAQTLVDEAFLPAAAPPSDSTGTLAATEASTPDAAAFSGTVVSPGVSGSLAATEASTPDTAALTGTVAWTPATGSLAATETGSDTAALTGTVAWPARTGTLAATESATADTAALAAQAIATAALAASETGNDTSAFAGTVSLTGSLNATESATADTAAFSGTVVTPGITGSLAATEDGSPDAASLSGTVVWPTRTGTLAATESATADTAALSGTVAWTGIFGTLAASEASTPDQAAFVGQLPVQATFSAQETGEDALAASGSVSDPGRIATLAAIESATPDQASFQLLASINGSLNASETGNDIASFTGTNRVQGDLAATDTGSDTAAATGTVAWATRIATLAAVESSSEDTAAFGLTAPVTGTLNASESGSDTAAFQGLVNYTGIAGALAATESATPDSAAGFTGTVAIQAVINAQESGDDTSAIVGSVAIQATLAAIEVASLDSAAIVGSVYYTGVTGSLAASEAATADAASFQAYVAINGYAHVSESTDPDTALIIGESVLTSTMVLDAIESSAPDQASIFAQAQVTAILNAQEIGEDHFFAGVIRATTFSLPQPRHTSSLGQNRHTESVNEPRETASEPQIRATASLPQDRHTVSLPQPRESP